MYPFGTAFIICSFNTKARVNPYLCTVGVFISYCTLLNSLPCPEYSFLSACLITAVFTLIKITGWAPNIPVKISAVALCFLVPAIIFKSNIFLSLLYALLEALTAVLSAIAFKNALDVINEKSRRKVLNSREFLCVGLLLSLSIAGTGGLSCIENSTGRCLCRIIYCSYFICLRNRGCNGMRGSLRGSVSSCKR